MCQREKQKRHSGVVRFGVCFGRIRALTSTGVLRAGIESIDGNSFGASNNNGHGTAGGVAGVWRWPGVGTITVEDA